MHALMRLHGESLKNVSETEVVIVTVLQHLVEGGKSQLTIKVPLLGHSACK